MGDREGHEFYVGHVPVHVPGVSFLFEGPSVGMEGGTYGLVLTVLDGEGDGGVVEDERSGTTFPRPWGGVDPRTPPGTDDAVKVTSVGEGEMEGPVPLVEPASGRGGDWGVGVGTRRE